METQSKNTVLVGVGALVVIGVPFFGSG
jgi:hypothetical protein